ncbi:citrate lyase acyl carrier protein [Budviciaceae bacterium BWR-B9]|uniref:Citrate lyase acyl carrier protein n=3 Tax=Limnobaculum TaxID=2172100 RepID=A0A9D7FQ35_9GAMM|nr:MULTISPECIES: citrate lyase acyl carrier protein [Limnobaculum]MBK5071504.1 citrate lyase acyl carrier protein [Limnobaculum xujianqingii]MBK5145211.1 citrate lyase acyl carrier protein [Limnobaculum allomyrinae]MBK5174813.1 citrate lyase acyl carrier protein [Limnobaculum xujianqingii]MBV7693043.1 citrate lyase acyl carrier protein [Limnobaculum sp. M2-1]QBH97794.1 citrate lyase acyl carrier protein [Limnobaculum zhutongyuii]
MKIVKEAVAGTLESSDVMVRIAPIGGSEIDLQLNSSVEKQFGDAIRETVMDTLSKLGVTGVQLIIDDKGALDCILRARLQTVLLRASDSKELPWGALK